jgi:hypothetical protein
MGCFLLLLLRHQQQRIREENQTLRPLIYAIISLHSQYPSFRGRRSSSSNLHHTHSNLSTQAPQLAAHPVTHSFPQKSKSPIVLYISNFGTSPPIFQCTSYCRSYAEVNSNNLSPSLLTVFLYGEENQHFNFQFNCIGLVVPLLEAGEEDGFSRGEVW